MFCGMLGVELRGLSHEFSELSNNLKHHFKTKKRLADPDWLDTFNKLFPFARHKPAVRPLCQDSQIHKMCWHIKGQIKTTEFQKKRYLMPTKEIFKKSQTPKKLLTKREVNEVRMTYALRETIIIIVWIISATETSVLAAVVCPRVDDPAATFWYFPSTSVYSSLSDWTDSNLFLQICWPLHKVYAP
jgi:hypothetical protein